MFLLIDKLNLTTTLDAHLFDFIDFTIKYLEMSQTTNNLVI